MSNTARLSQSNPLSGPLHGPGAGTGCGPASALRRLGPPPPSRRPQSPAQQPRRLGSPPRPGRGNGMRAGVGAKAPRPPAPVPPPSSPGPPPHRDGGGCHVQLYGLPRPSMGAGATAQMAPPYRRVPPALPPRKDCGAPGRRAGPSRLAFGIMPRGGPGKSVIRLPRPPRSVSNTPPPFRARNINTQNHRDKARAQS